MLIETKTTLEEKLLINIDNIETIYYDDNDKGNIMRVFFVSGDDCIINENYKSFLEKIKQDYEKTN